MKNIFLAADNVADTATFTASGSHASLPVSNLGTDDVDQMWQSNTAAGIKSFRVELPAAISLAALDLRKHNFSAGTTIRVRTNPTAFVVSDVFAVDYDSGFVNAKQMVYTGTLPSNWGDQYDFPWYFGTRSVRYIVVEISDPVNQFTRIGRFFAGAASFQPVQNAQWGLESKWDDLSSFVETGSGKRHFNSLPRVRNESFALRLTPAESDTLHDILGITGKTEEVLYLRDPDNPAANQRYGGLGTLSNVNPFRFSQFATMEHAFEWRHKQ